MRQKEREAPRKLLSLEVLDQRIVKSHEKVPLIKQDLWNRRSGYKGEQSIDYHLSFLPEKQYYILHDLRLQNQRGYFFQIDTLIISPYFITIIEVKNYGGTITFDTDFNQLIQAKKSGERRALKDPVSQMNRHIYQLKSLLEKNKFTSAPIKPLILISNPSTIIATTSNPSYFRSISHIINLEEKINTFSLMHKVEVYSQKEIRKLSRLLIKLNTLPEYNVLKHFSDSP